MGLVLLVGACMINTAKVRAVVTQANMSPKTAASWRFARMTTLAAQQLNPPRLQQAL